MEFKVKRNELYHHGVKGQRWGIRRYQYEDGSLTDEGRQHYGIKERIALKKEERALKKEAKIENKAKDYVKAGYSKDVARKLAESDARCKKALLIIGGVTVAALAGYGIYKYARARGIENLANNGTVLKVGDQLQRIASNKDDVLNYNFYASYDKIDNMKYRGGLGLARAIQAGKMPFKSTLEVTKDLRVAPENEAKKVFESLISRDPDVKKALDMAGQMGVRGDTPWEAFNRSLVLHDNAFEGTYTKFSLDTQWQKFYDALKEKGYSAVLDVNDRKYSGYNAKAPIIVFDKSAVAVKNIEKLGTGTMVKDLIGNELYENGAQKIATLGLAASVGALTSNDNRKEKIGYKPNSDW